MDIRVDINKNFNMVTAFGSFPISEHMDEYVFKAAFPSLTHYFFLRFPIKKEDQEKYQKLINAIQRATTFAKKDWHFEAAW